MQAAAEDALEARFGFPRFAEGADRLGWLMNMQQSCMADKETGQMVSAIDCYFMCQVRRCGAVVVCGGGVWCGMRTQ